eukprot:364700-Chlamydomonas_euryale.AAC.3
MFTPGITPSCPHLNASRVVLTPGDQPPATSLTSLTLILPTLASQALRYPPDTGFTSLTLILPAPASQALR